MYDMIGKMTAAQAGRDELISILLEGVATGSGVRRTDGGRSHRMCSRAVRCWGRESAQHRTTSYGLRFAVHPPVVLESLLRRRSLPAGRLPFHNHTPSSGIRLDANAIIDG